MEGTLANQGGVVQGRNTSTSTLTVTAAQYNTVLGNNSQVTYRATKAGAFDQISVYKLEDAARGTNAAVVRITSSGATVFRNNQGTVTLAADVYVGGSATAVPSGSINSYRWTMDGNVIMGATTRTLTVSAADIMDNGASLYQCTIDFDDDQL